MSFVLNVAKTAVVNMFMTKRRAVRMLTEARYDGNPHQPVLTRQLAGLLRVFVLEGRNLLSADRTVSQVFGIGRGSSDPYCVLQVGRTRVRTPTKKSTLNPVWNFYCEFPVLKSGVG